MVKKFKNIHKRIQLNKKNNIILLLLVTIFNINFSFDLNLFANIFITGIAAYTVLGGGVYLTNNESTVNKIYCVRIGVNRTNANQNFLATFKTPLILPMWLSLFYLIKM